MTEPILIVDVRWHQDPVHGWVLVANLAGPDRELEQDWMADQTESGPPEQDTKNPGTTN